MTERRISPRVLILALTVAGLLVAGFAVEPDRLWQTDRPELRQALHLRVLRVDEGWGYAVDFGDRTLIHQPYIPAVQGEQPFASRSEARKTGKLAMEKMILREQPHICRAELDSLGITYQ